MTRETRSSELAAVSGASPDPPVRAEGAGAEGIASSGRTDAVSAGLVSGEERFAVPAHGGKAASMSLGRSRRPASPSAARRKRRSERAPVENGLPAVELLHFIRQFDEGLFNRRERFPAWQTPSTPGTTTRRSSAR